MIEETRCGTVVGKVLEHRRGSIRLTKAAIAKLILSSIKLAFFQKKGGGVNWHPPPPPGPTTDGG